MSLGDLLIEDPRRSRVLEGLGLDYCCNGHRPLSEAVSEASLDLTAVAKALDLPDPPPAQDTAMPAQNAALAHDIVDTHHAYMWAEMPRLQALVDKVAGVHGDRHPELLEVQATYTKAVAALDPHMSTEERVVFPAITKMEKSQALERSLADDILELRAEHDAVGELLKSMAGIEAVHVPFNGSPPAVLSTVQGETQMIFAVMQPLQAQVQAGKLRAIAVTTPRRFPLLPDLPAVAETYPGFEALAWNGLVVPAGTPPAVVQKINAEVGAILKQPEIVQRMNGFGFDLVGGTPADFAALIQSEAERWTPVVKKLGIKVD